MYPVKKAKKWLDRVVIFALSAAIVMGVYGIRASAEEGEDSSAMAAVKTIALASTEDSDVLTANSLTFGATTLVSLYDVVDINSRTRAMELSVDTESRSETEEGTLVTRTITLDDIPLVEVYIDDGEEKPLLLFLHGIGLDKESVLPYLEDYAVAGYHAVSMDAYGQGDRAEEGILYDDWASVLVTVTDIDQVVEFYGIVPDVSTEDFVLGGFSMGGIETWVYAELGSYTPAALLPISGICDTDAWNEGRLNDSCIAWMTTMRSSVRVVYQQQEAGYSQVKYTTIEGLDVTENLESFTDIPIFMAIGTADYYFSSTGAQNVIEAIQEAGNENAVINIYEGIPHTVTPQMVADSIAFLQEIMG
ncbi:MAG: alpha/beta hydrolase [Oscillospiraceae bacterium]|nr:alpha/beta hydrolase [Oscillospiraceae bacterium]